MTLDIRELPEKLGATAVVAWDNILERADDTQALELAAAAAEAPVASQLPRVLACSPFVADLARRNARPFCRDPCRRSCLRANPACQAGPVFMPI